MEDLKRTVSKGQAHAWCWQGDFDVKDVWYETAAARAREHTRETGHWTQVTYEHTTEYRPF